MPEAVRDATKVALRLRPRPSDTRRMNIPHPICLATAALAAAALAVPGAAAAKGGSNPAPAPTPAPVLCDYAQDGPTAAGGYVFSNQAGDAGCITVISSGTSIRLYSLALTPGWTADVTANGDGTAGGVRVTFQNTQSGAKIDARIEPGKTWIR
jgi:hypothetical protein